MLKENVYLAQEDKDFKTVLWCSVAVAFVLLVLYSGSLFLSFVIVSQIVLTFPMTQLIYSVLW